MSLKRTPQQDKAITLTDRDLIVSAGAGSGKTMVLVERFIHLLNQNINLDQILAITFTRKAALEMKERIRTKLADEITGIDQAHISTIHSFCQKLVTEHPRQAAVDPRFRMAEEWESRGLLYQVTQTQLGTALAKGDQGVVQVRESFRQTKELVDYLVEIYERMLSKGVSDFVVIDQTAEIQQQISIYRQEFQTTIERWLGELDFNLLSAAKKPVVAKIERLWEQNSAYLAELEIESQIEILSDFRSLFGGNWAKDLKEQVVILRELAEIYRQQLQDLVGNQNLVQISQLLTNIDQQYQEHKIQAGLLDFNDLELLAVKLLQDPEVQESYQFKHVMVDEAQDINPVQNQIISLLTKNHDTKLFVVGDPKQSIYQFRGADVDEFLETQSVIEKEGEYVHLAKNFRSKSGIIKFTNGLFKNLMAQDTIKYEQVDAHHSGSPADVKIMIGPKPEAIGEVRITEGETIANKIAKLVASGYQYRDITILLRTMGNAQVYEQALQAAQIPFVNLSGRGFYEKQEIKDILNFVAWLQDSEEAVSKIAVLRSPFFGISDEGLYWYQLGEHTQINPIDQEKLEDAYQLYPEAQQALVSLSAPKFFDYLIEITDFARNTLTLPMGEQRLANIKKLQATSWQLWAKGYTSINEQLHYIEQLIDQRGKEGEARLDSEDADVVTIMTIHGSKGLEFRIVILADLNRTLTNNRHGYLIYHPQSSLAVKNTSEFNHAKDLINAEEIAEAKRLLYVGITRAQDKLILSGAGNSEDYDLAKPITELKTWWEWILWGLTDEKLSNSVTIVDPEELKNVTAPQVVATPTYDEGQTEPNPELPVQYRSHSFSVTSLMIYARCPRRYYYRYLLRVPELGVDRGQTERTSGLDPLKRGNIVHRVCEHLDETQDQEQLLDWATAMEGLQVTAREKQELSEIITRYATSPYYRKSQSYLVERELEFALPLDEFSITGTIDQLIHEDQGLTITDLKTNHIQAYQVNEVAKEYYWQLRIYAWAISQLKDQPVHQTGLYFLLPNVIHKEPVTQTEIQETEAWLETTCHNIQAGSLVGASAFPKGSNCSYCPYDCEQIIKMRQSFAEIIAGLGRLEEATK